MNQVPVLKGWKSYFLWEGLPFLMLLYTFGLIAPLNWRYESKLFIADQSASDAMGGHLGITLLTFALGGAFIASVLLFGVRLIARISSPRMRSGWFLFVPLVFISILLIFPALFIVILGPAAITMVEQTRHVPSSYDQRHGR